MFFFRHKKQTSKNVAETTFKDTEFEIRNKLIDLLTELKGFKFVTTLVLEFKKK